MDESASKATELVADVAEEVAEQATQIAASSRGMSGRDLGLIFGGVAVGAGLGATLGFIFSRRILETKYNQIAEEEIAVMREHYQNKVVALENTTSKGKLEDLIKEQKYSPEMATPPMAIAPPIAVVEAAEDALEEAEAGAPPVVAELSAPAEGLTRNIFEEAAQVNDNWDYHKELAGRSPVRPYVIHIDERDERPYDEVTLTYYDGDDVLCDERDEVIGSSDRDRMIGETNLEKFGHGSNDTSVVYIRNDKMETQYEIIRSPNSYAQEVHGFEHADTRRYRKKGCHSTMSSNSLSEDYLRWLEPQTRDANDDPGRSYWDLLSIMYEKEFVWLIPNDDNRIVDGLDLRIEFCYSQHIRSNALRNLGPCSFLEVLIGLSRRLSFAAGGSPPGWAWQLATNLELNKLPDSLSQRKKAQVHGILDAVVWRTYMPDGMGGFFPLAWPDDDQTKIELWYQMANYVEEIHPEF